MIVVERPRQNLFGTTPNKPTKIPKIVAQKIPTTVNFSVSMIPEIKASLFSFKIPKTVRSSAVAVCDLTLVSEVALPSVYFLMILSYSPLAFNLARPSLNILSSSWFCPFLTAKPVSVVLAGLVTTFRSKPFLIA